MTTLLTIIQIILTIYGYLLIATALLTWIPDVGETHLGHFLTRLTEPYLALFRRFIPGLRIGSVMLDLSFIVAVVVYFFLQDGVVSILSMVLQ
ncbi:YggT family protein [Alicyclobacillus cycloheptanicus]|jgi:YggT family protein|uniref:YggT family protein n=1 Tax=Alicyclobacillus cycloheptanicus TaxID=1457 RepID=A0ABT9XLJ4_9BACL|nr:YggT family protein [Alicyclobacillus cycloheptanicus]MDQ0190985.1 YggT family protein [Alicyclobacillus cycloheptanicus]WDM01488.1 YggT family protein [Alicyclobacillus cycloheptanicus]